MLAAALDEEINSFVDKDITMSEPTSFAVSVIVILDAGNLRLNCPQSR